MWWLCQTYLMLCYVKLSCDFFEVVTIIISATFIVKTYFNLLSREQQFRAEKRAKACLNEPDTMQKELT